jgi:hypothetical protein
MNLDKKLIFTLIIGAFFCNVNAQKKYDEKNIDLVCSVTERNIVDVLFNMAARTDNFNKEYSIETMREVHADSMGEVKDKLSKIAADLKIKNDSGFIDLGLNSANEAFKYGLCEKFKRKTASINTIAKEGYFLCRKTINEGIEKRPPPCF